MALPFLDTNVILRHLLQDHPDFSPRATAYLTRIAKEEIKVRTADTVILEAVFTLQRTYHYSKDQIRQALLPIIDLPALRLPGRRRLHKALALYHDLNISFNDAYYAVLLMQEMGLTEVISFDRDFDRVPGVERREPNRDGT